MQIIYSHLVHGCIFIAVKRCEHMLPVFRYSVQYSRHGFTAKLVFESNIGVSLYKFSIRSFVFDANEQIEYSRKVHRSIEYILHLLYILLESQYRLIQLRVRVLFFLLLAIMQFDALKAKKK